MRLRLVEGASYFKMIFIFEQTRMDGDGFWCAQVSPKTMGKESKVNQSKADFCEGVVRKREREREGGREGARGKGRAGGQGANISRTVVLRCTYSSKCHPE